MNDIYVSSFEELMSEIDRQHGKWDFQIIVENVLNKNFVRLNESGLRVIETYWDYRDVDALDAHLKAALCKLEGDFKTADEVRDAVLWSIDECALNENWYGEVEHSSYRELINDICEMLSSRFNIDASEVYYSDWYEYLGDEWNVVFDNGIAEHLDSATIQVNLMFDVGDEWNYEHTSIRTMKDSIASLRDDDVDPDVDNFTLEDPEIRENSLTWLVYSQGYTLSDVFASDKSTPFLDSVRDELDNYVDHAGKLTCLAKIDFSTYCELRAHGGRNFAIDPKQARGYEYFQMGIVNDRLGSGSVLGIDGLEKPLVFNSTLISDIQIESRDWSRGYTVDSIYGLGYGAWSSCIVPTDEPVFEVPQIDYNALAKDVSAYARNTKAEALEALARIAAPPANPGLSNRLAACAASAEARNASRQGAPEIKSPSKDQR